MALTTELGWRPDDRNDLVDALRRTAMEGVGVVEPQSAFLEDVGDRSRPGRPGPTDFAR